MAVVVDCRDTKPRFLRKVRKIMEIPPPPSLGVTSKPTIKTHFLFILKRVEDLRPVRMIISQQEAK